MQSIIKNEFNEHIKTSKKTMEASINDIEIAANICINSLKNGNKILIFGNGGSAADAQHIAAEIIGRYKTDRKGLAAIALTTDSSVLTAISNDFGYSEIFKRQVEALARPGDTLIGISTGGSSQNVVNALKIAQNMQCKAIGLSGKDGGEFNTICNVNIAAKAQDTARIQEMHILIGHTICHLIDQAFIEHPIE
jgi:D-sedoheptulose 7-phosphate isomerase